MQLLPALVEGDLPELRRTRCPTIQRVTGAWFASAAGRDLRARAAPATLVAKMAEWGAAGVGQSSWGPAVYGLVGTDGRAGSWPAGRGGSPGERGAGFRGGICRLGGPGLAGRTGAANP